MQVGEVFNSPQTGSVYTVLGESNGLRLSYRVLHGSKVRLRVVSVDNDADDLAVALKSLQPFGFDYGQTGQEHISVLVSAGAIESTMNATLVALGLADMGIPLSVFAVDKPQELQGQEEPQGQEPWAGCNPADFHQESFLGIFTSPQTKSQYAIVATFDNDLVCVRHLTELGAYRVRLQSDNDAILAGFVMHALGPWHKMIKDGDHVSGVAITLSDAVKMIDEAKYYLTHVTIAGLTHVTIAG
jgi:hypothetical protein